MNWNHTLAFSWDCCHIISQEKKTDFKMRYLIYLNSKNVKGKQIDFKTFIWFFKKRGCERGWVSCLKYSVEKCKKAKCYINIFK